MIFQKQESVKAAIINKRAGGTGLILGRMAFQRPFKEGVKILQVSSSVSNELKPIKILK